MLEKEVPCPYRPVPLICINFSLWLGSVVTQLVKNLPAVQETRVQSLGWEDPPEKEMAAHSSILAWEIPWTEGYRPWSCKRVGYNLVTKQ